MPSSADSHVANRPRAASNEASPNPPPIPISITICGDGGCGKSSITLRLVRSQWTSEYDPTIEDSYSITRRIDGVVYHLSLTDTAGQEEYRGMWASSNLGADAFLMVYDITAKNSLDALGYFNDLVDMEVDTRADNAQRARRAGVNPVAEYGSSGSAKTVAPVKIVAGNKCDLQAIRQVSAATGLDWARRRGCGFMETSARFEVNIEETFALIVRRVVEARRQAETGIPVADTPIHSIRAANPLSRLATSDRVSSSEKLDGRPSASRGPNLHGDRGGADSFWRKLRCW